MNTPTRDWLGRQRGQTLVLFTFMVVVFFGFLAMVVDLGFVFGQRRYDQNGADAAALAAAQYLASNVQPANQSGTQVYFGVTDAAVYDKVRQYAGLPPTGSSHSPDGTNQNSGLDSNNQLVVILEYAPDGTTWCVSPASNAANSDVTPTPPNRSPAVPTCTLYSTSYPPQPTAIYKVRVTVSSTTGTSFAAVIPGVGNLVGPSGAQSKLNAPACAAVGSSTKPRMLTCAQAIADIAGSSTYQGKGPVIPMTACDSQLGVPGSAGTLYQLWGQKGSVCGLNLGNWKQTLDFTSETMWCNGTSPDYLGLVNSAKLRTLLPQVSVQVAGSPCAGMTYDTTWNRTGYAADTTYPGTGVQNYDVPMWVSRGFGGTIPIGDMLPTYTTDSPSQTGNEGNNIALGLYCDNSVTLTRCPNDAGSGTWLFAGLQSACADDYGQLYGSGCVDVTVLTWTNPQTANLNGKSASWSTTTNGSPDRVQIANYRNFRIYCDWTVKNGQKLCNAPPSSLPGVSAGNSTAWGRYLGPYVGSCPPGVCGGPPSLNGDTATLGG